MWTRTRTSPQKYNKFLIRSLLPFSQLKSTVYRSNYLHLYVQYRGWTGRIDLESGLKFGFRASSFGRNVPKKAAKMRRPTAEIWPIRKDSRKKYQSGATTAAGGGCQEGQFVAAHIQRQLQRRNIPCSKLIPSTAARTRRPPPRSDQSGVAWNTVTCAKEGKH